MNAELRHPDKVVINLHDETKIIGIVNEIFQTTSGVKVRVTSGQLVLVVKQDQVEVEQ